MGAAAALWGSGTSSLSHPTGSCSPPTIHTLASPCPLAPVPHHRLAAVLGVQIPHLDVLVLAAADQPPPAALHKREIGDLAR